jgi:hypothetical protein
MRVNIEQSHRCHKYVCIFDFRMSTVKIQLNLIAFLTNIGWDSSKSLWEIWGKFLTS